MTKNRHTGKLLNFLVQSSSLTTADMAVLERSVLAEEPRDIHTELAAQIFNCPTWAVTEEMRRRAKAIGFHRQYGGYPSD